MTSTEQNNQTSIDSYLDTLGTPLLKGKVRKYLSSELRYKGTVMNRAKFITELISSGYNPMDYQVDKVKPMSRTAAFRASNEDSRRHEERVNREGKISMYVMENSDSVYDITKISYDYANYVLNLPK